MNIPDHIQKAIQAYYAERATPDDVAALEAWFREDPAHVRAFAELGMVEWQMLCEQEKADAAAIMSTIQEAEDGDSESYSFLNAPVIQPSPIDRNRVTFRDVCAVAGYLAAKGLQTRPGMISAIAAVLLFGTLIYVSIFGLGDASAPSNTADISTDQPSTPVPQIVATLTAERDAVWERRPGQDLYAGQRFMLTQGFAEITTESGAVAILEAPATVELIDDDNAIRLHAGKLVGICETPASKGFVVRTPRMDVTDLGTRFGVAIDPAGNTLAEVFEGSIEVSPTPQNNSRFAPIRLGSGDAVVVDIAGTQVERDHFASEAFAGLVEHASQRLDIASGGTASLQWVEQDFFLHSGDSVIPQTEQPWIFRELQGYTLLEDLVATAHELGRYYELPEASFGTIPKGTRISSYIIGLNPKAADDAATQRVIVGEWAASFDGRVIGVIANETHWKQFDRAIYGQAADALIPVDADMMIETRQIGGPRESYDWFGISPEFRRTIPRSIRFRFHCSNEVDLIRVLVIEDDQP